MIALSSATKPVASIDGTRPSASTMTRVSEPTLPIAPIAFCAAPKNSGPAIS